MVCDFLGMEPFHNFAIPTGAQDRLKRGQGRSGRLFHLPTAFVAPLLEEHPVAVLLGQPGRRASIGQIGLDLLSMAVKRRETGLQTLLGRLAVPQGPGVDLQGLVFTAFSELTESRDSGSETFHRWFESNGGDHGVHVDRSPLKAAFRADQASPGDIP